MYPSSRSVLSQSSTLHPPRLPEVGLGPGPEDKSVTKPYPPCHPTILDPETEVYRTPRLTSETTYDRHAGTRPVKGRVTE